VAVRTACFKVRTAGFKVRTAGFKVRSAGFKTPITNLYRWAVLTVVVMAFFIPSK
jgi:hypothetical protein